MSRRERWPPHIPSRRPFGTEDAGPGRGWVAPPRSASGAVASPERLLGCTHLVPGTAANTHGRQKPSLARERGWPERLATGPVPGRAQNMRQDRLNRRCGVPGRLPGLEGHRSGGSGRCRFVRSAGERLRAPKRCRVGSPGLAEVLREGPGQCRAALGGTRASRPLVGEAPVVRSRSALRARAGHRDARGSDPTLFRRRQSGGRLRRPRPGAPDRPTLRERISGSWPQSVQATTVLPRCRARGGRGTTQRSPTTLARSPSRLRSRSARVLERYPTVDSVVRSALRDPS